MIRQAGWGGAGGWADRLQRQLPVHHHRLVAPAEQYLGWEALARQRPHPSLLQLLAKPAEVAEALDDPPRLALTHALDDVGGVLADTVLITVGLGVRDPDPRDHGQLLLLQDRHAVRIDRGAPAVGSAHPQRPVLQLPALHHLELLPHFQGAP